MISYSTIVFDAGGTLLQLNYDMLARAYLAHAESLGTLLDYSNARAVVEQLESEIPTWQQTRKVSLEKNNGREFWDSFFTEGFRRMGIAGDVSAAATDIRECFQRAEFEMLFADVKPTLSGLATRGKTMGILSNFSTNLEDILRRLAIHHYFEFFVVSAVAGMEKPDPRIFDLTVRAARQPRQEIVCVGDSLFHDVQGAQSAGMPAILLDRRNRYPDFAGARMRDLHELL